MIKLQDKDKQLQDFFLKDQLKQQEMATLHFLFNSQFQLAREKLQEKTPIQTQTKKYQRSVAINSEQLRRSFNALSQKLHEKYLRQDRECLKSLNKLQTLWQAKKIEIFHKHYFERYIENTHLKNISTLLRNQEHLMRLDQHIYFSIEKAIWARQACLNHIKRQLKNMGPQDMYEHFQTVKDREFEKNRKMQQRVYKVYGFRAKYILDERETKLQVTKMQMISEDINNYRKLTYHLVELIANWKLYIQSLTHDLRLRRQKIEFYHFNYNHLLYILNDSSFISTSFFSNFYTFAIKNDPFLLRPILNIEKQIQEGKQVTFQIHQLKRIINCKPDDVPRMVLALNQLYKQVEWNLIHKKYSEKSNFLKFKSVTLQKINTQKKIPSLKYVKLAHLPCQKSNKRSLSETKRQKSLLFSKSNVLLRKTSLISNASLSNTLQGKDFRINNPQSKSNIKLFNNQELKSLKEQIYNKIKQQLEYQTKKTILESKTFADLVNQQVKASFQKHINNQQQQIVRNNIEITPLSFAEQEISNYITLIYKQIPVQYKYMQTTQNDLIKEVLEANYCYILKVHTKANEIGNIVAFCNRQIKQYKSIEVKLFLFKFQQLFQKMILKLVQFLWKYDNAKQIAFSLKYNNEQTQRFVKQLSKKLQLNCIIIEKRHKTYIQSRFVFTNKDFNKRYIYNPHPQKVHFKLYSALCLQKLQLQTINVQQLSKILNYDYLIMQILKIYTNSEDFHILRDTFQSKERLRYLLNQLMEIQKHKQYQIDMTIIEQQNLMNINQKLKYMKKPLLQASDLILINNIKLIILEYTLTIAYKLQVLSPGNGQMCHRYAINEEISYFCDSKGTDFYLLPVRQSQHLKIILFSAHQYLKNHQKSLNIYLFETLAKNKWNKKYVESIWIQMMRYPQNYSEREEFMLNTYRVNDFDSIKKQLLIGDTFDWFSDIQIQNGVQYVMHKNDLHLKMPLGVGVITNKNWIIYSRVLQRGQTLLLENG